MTETLGFGTPGPEAPHLCIDVQRLSGPGSPWAVRWIDNGHDGAMTIFSSRFLQQVETVPRAEEIEAVEGPRRMPATKPLTRGGDNRLAGGARHVRSSAPDGNRGQRG